MITLDNLYYALNGLVSNAKFSFRPIENAMPGEIPLANWSVDWSTENTAPCPTELEVDAYLTDDMKHRIEANEAIGSLNLATQNHLDNTAKSKDYDDSISIATYVAGKNVKWKDEAQTFIDWRDDVLAYAYAQYDLIQSGSVPIPTIEEFIESLPKITWPTQG